jgi:CheY-like chemotaxis protein
VLVVDDDVATRTVLCSVLHEEGYDVQGATDGADALWRARRWRPDVILLDLVMPMMNGWTFAEAYHDQPGPHATIIAMTAAAAGAKQAADAIGASEVLVKPFDFGQLLELISVYARYGSRLDSATGAA